MPLREAKLQVRRGKTAGARPCMIAPQTQTVVDMFPGVARYDLQRIGVAMVLFGAACITIASLATLFSMADSMRGSANSSLAAILAFWQAISSLANVLIFNGVALYVFGRLAKSWSVSLVGFEHSAGDELVVRRPDGSHTVWIGRRYGSLADAESAAAALKQRLGGDRS